MAVQIADSQDGLSSMNEWMNYLEMRNLGNYYKYGYSIILF
jgi:hypothetical protein